MTTATQTTTQLRRKAADIVEVQGLWQDIPGQEDNRSRDPMDERWVLDVDWSKNPLVEVCMLEALAIAGGDDRHAPTMGAIHELREELGVRNLVAWSDTPGRTKEEVAAVLRGKQS